MVFCSWHACPCQTDGTSIKRTKHLVPALFQLWPVFDAHNSGALKALKLPQVEAVQCLHRLVNAHFQELSRLSELHDPVFSRRNRKNFQRYSLGKPTNEIEATPNGHRQGFSTPVTVTALLQALESGLLTPPLSGARRRASMAGRGSAAHAMSLTAYGRTAAVRSLQCGVGDFQ